jgi:RHS repeat-associated protein
MDPPAKLTARYDGLGRLSALVDDQGHAKAQAFDLAGRLLSVDDPDAGSTTYAYDAAGNVVEWVDGRGVTTRQAFDGANRRVARWDDADEAGTKAEWVYDAAPDCPAELCTNTEGLLAEARYPGVGFGADGLSDAPGRDRTGYDPRGRPVAFERVIEGHAYAAAMAYDNADRLVSTTSPDGREIRRRYDDASRLVEVPGVVAGIDYDDRGLTAAMRLADGTTDTWTWDSRMRLAGSRTTGPGAAVLQGFDATRDRVGNVTRIADAGHAHGPGEAAEQIHDAWYRLTEVRYGGETVRYAFDRIDRVTSQTSTVPGSAADVGDYAYDGAGPNAVTAAGGLRLAYDEAGNVTERGGVALAWDHLERLTAAGDGARFAYGPDADRLARDEDGSVTHSPLADFDVRDGVSALYVRAGGRRVARLESAALATDLLSDLNHDGEIDAGDAWLARKGQPGSPVRRLLWSAVRRRLASDAPTFLHAGPLGSLTLATSGGEVTGQRAFYPTGEERPGGFGYVDEYGFTGQERDRSTGLLHFRARYLDPRLGRWTAPDPLFAQATPATLGRLGQSTTAYAYVANAFGDAADPLGLVGERASPLIEAHNAQVRSRGARPGGATRDVARQGREQEAARAAVTHNMQMLVPDLMRGVATSTPHSNQVEGIQLLAVRMLGDEIQERIDQTARDGGNLRPLQAYGRALDEAHKAIERLSIARQGGRWDASFESLASWNHSWAPTPAPNDAPAQALMPAPARADYANAPASPPYANAPSVNAAPPNVYARSPADQTP